MNMMKYFILLMCGKSIICCTAVNFLLIDIVLLMEDKIVEMKSMIEGN